MNKTFDYREKQRESIESPLDDLNKNQCINNRYPISINTITNIVLGVATIAFIAGAYSARAFLNIRR